MFQKVISFSLSNKLLVLLAVGLLIAGGIYSGSQIPLDAVPDITNNQVQVVCTAPTLAPQEVEQLVTYPLEASMTNIPNLSEIRSISRYGLCVITLVFEEQVPIMLARQFVQEQLNLAAEDLPSAVAKPEIMPITTGLGEIYQYVLTVDKAQAPRYDATQLRTIQDWIVKRQLNGVEGVIEISSFGGYLKEYEIALLPAALKAHQLSISDVIEAVQRNNQNSGGSYIEKGPNSFYIRTRGRVSDQKEIGAIRVKNEGEVPVLVRDVARVRIGSAKRYGAMTMDGKGEVVGGITLMLKGANSYEVLRNVQERIATISGSLPEGVNIYPYLDRSKLIDSTIHTVRTNLIEGGLIVIFVLLLLLGNIRAGLIVASIIPLSMLFSLIMMRLFGISANLMSLGAIDFGIVVDGAVIIVESLLYTLALAYVGKRLTQDEMDRVVRDSTSKIYRSAAFGVLIILMVFIPILTLEGIEGKTFRPMAQTVGFAILGSMFLSLTYVPVMASIFLKGNTAHREGLADRFVNWLKRAYAPILGTSMKRPILVVLASVILFFASIGILTGLGTEFVPTLEEGDLAMQQAIKPGSSLQESIHTASMAEKILLENFPEVKHVVSKIGTAEVPTDPMAIEDADVMIILKDKEEWTSAKSREGLVALMKAKLEPITWASFEFTQPIQLRFNELMTGAKADISVKIFGENLETLKSKADQAAELISGIEGAGDVKVDQTEGLQQLAISYDRARMAQFGVDIEEVNQILRAAYAGEKVGDFFEEERKFDLVVRLAPSFRQDLDLDQLYINTHKGRPIPLSEIARVTLVEGPMLISREQARRFINIGINVRNRDVGSLVAEIQQTLDSSLDLPPGYEIQYGGQFENLQRASDRLMLGVPLALGLILLFLYLAFGSVKDALIVFAAVPLSAIGGILALWIRGMPFSISSGVGFIALFGVSVLNGIVLVSAIRQLDIKDFSKPGDLIASACQERLRPVLITALVAALGFLPMALSHGNGAEVQRPLATVVIGGLISSTLLTLFVLPNLYLWINRKQMNAQIPLILLALLFVQPLFGQDITSPGELCDYAMKHHWQAQNIDLDKDATKLGRKALIPWGDFQVSYQGGQINYQAYDHFFTLSQDFSPLIRFGERKAKKELIRKEIEFLDIGKASWENRLRYELLLASNNWQHLYSQGLLMEELLVFYKKVKGTIEKRAAEGEIDPLDEELFYGLYNEVYERSRIIKRDLLQTEINIRKLGILPDSISLNLGELNLAQNQNEAFSKDSNLLNQTLAQEIRLIEGESKLNKAKGRQASLDLGVFAQSLEQEFPFQGLNIGLGIPLDRRQTRIRSQQLELEKEKIENRRVQQLLQIKQEISGLKDSRALVLQRIETYEKSILPRQKPLKEKNRSQFYTGEIDILRFTKIQELVINQQIQYLDRIRDYNEYTLRIQFLNQNK